MDQTPSLTIDSSKPSQGTIPLPTPDEIDKNIEGEILRSSGLDPEVRNELQGESKKQLKRYSLAFSLTTFGVCQPFPLNYNTCDLAS